MKYIILTLTFVLSCVGQASFMTECFNIDKFNQKYMFYFIASCHGKNRSKFYQAVYDPPTSPEFLWDQVGDEGLFEIKSTNLFMLNFEKDQMTAVVDLNDNATSTLSSPTLGTLKLSCKRSQ